jgi:catechol 2,3-dioxygenase-like lactoylglutathione lyase family enzyme
MTEITDIRTVGVPVTDQERALEFYLDKLGFETRMDVPVPQFGGRWIEVAPRGAASPPRRRDDRRGATRRRRSRPRP